MLPIFIHIFQHLISSAFVSDVNGLIRRIIYLIFIAPHCNVTIPLAQHCVIINWPLCGVSYLKAALLLRINLSLTF